MSTDGPDHRLFRQLLQELPPNGSIAYLRSWNPYNFRFDWEQLEQLNDFEHTWSDAVHEFTDPTLNGTLCDLRTFVGQFIRHMTNVGFICGGASENLPLNYEIYPGRDNAERSEAARVASEMASNITGTFDYAIREGRSNLGITVFDS